MRTVPVNYPQGHGMSTVQITKEKLRELTDSGSWDRGVGYFEQGRVFRLMVDGTTVIAKVIGTHEYKVELWAGEDRIHGACTCPMGDEGVFCKHCVATGLECLEKGIGELHPGEGPSHSTDPGEGGPETGVTHLETIREYLSGEDREELIEIIVAQAKLDESLLRRLATRAAMSKGEGPSIEAFKRAVDEATSSIGFVGYEASFDFATSVNEVLDEIENLLHEGHAEEVVELSEYAVEAVEGALDHVDDSSGMLGDVLYQLEELHQEACVAAEPDPKALAESLFLHEITSGYDAFSGAAQTYADVLGEEGLAEYRRLAEEKWRGLPKLKPGGEGSYGHSRYALRRIMESLAEAEGDIEELVAIKSRDLSRPYNYLDIAEIYRGDRQYNKAMEWAEKGLAAFPDSLDPGLREFLANEYHRRGRHSEASELMWGGFSAQPNLNTYKRLKEHAERAGDWPRWREHALAHMAEQAESQNADDAGRRWSWQRPADGTQLVKVYLWEKDSDAAWQAAQKYGCWREQWLELAALREDDHPRDAIKIYQGKVARLVQLTKNAAYRDATRLVRRIQKLTDRLAEQDKFEQYIDSLRIEFKRKRNFMKMLREFG